MQYEADSFYELAQAQALYSIVGSFHSNYHSKEGTHDHISGIKEGGNTIILGGAGPMGLMAIRYVLGMKKKPRRLVITDTNQERLGKSKENDTDAGRNQAWNRALLYQSIDVYRLRSSVTGNNQ